MLPTLAYVFVLLFWSLFFFLLFFKYPVPRKKQKTKKLSVSHIYFFFFFSLLYVSYDDIVGLLFFKLINVVPLGSGRGKGGGVFL